MSKFKVGDKVRVLPHDWVSFDMEKQIGKVGKITFDDGTGHMQYRLDIGQACAPWEECCLELVEPRREFIVIRRDGAKMIAELRHDRDVIKSAKATCAPSDTFDFDTGAKLAFDRMMGREEPQSAPKPSRRFKVGDRVVVLGKYSGEIRAIDDQNKYNEFYLVYCPEVGFHSGGEHGVHCKPEHLGNCRWRGEKDLSPAPAHEPPKFYTGKVFATNSSPMFKSRDGKVFKFIDGVCVNSNQCDLMTHTMPFVSFEQIAKEYSSTTWHEVKE